VLSVKDPDEFAIYDARVAACLNAIQLEATSKNKIFFPIPQSRNSIISKFAKIFTREALLDIGFEDLERDDVYLTYLKLIRRLGDLEVKKIIEIEMYLFSMGPEICERRLQFDWRMK
jgi:hypothetical protein